MKEIKDYEQYLISIDGEVFRFGRSLKITPPTKNYKYYTIGLCKNSKQDRFLLHRLIAEAYIPNPKGFKTVNHINGNKLDNRLENLEWCSQSYNIQHAYDIGIKKANHATQYKNYKPIVQMDMDGNVIREWHSLNSAARELKISKGSLSACLYGKRKTCAKFKWEYKII